MKLIEPGVVELTEGEQIPFACSTCGYLSQIDITIGINGEEMYICPLCEKPTAAIEGTQWSCEHPEQPAAIYKQVHFTGLPTQPPIDGGSK